ncbi:MAG TPA: IscS subfamily cysteine desulfurase, partial [Deltaproteobacteria bacterium]|nr:IscS subfamily cysteine desulfurase [Deltaproteobacteria bacterium]
MDGHATTRVDPRVVEAMVPFFTDHFGNASSRHHQFGWTARDAV